MSIPEVSVPVGENEPRYTAAEWARINADQMCSEWGHDYVHRQVQAENLLPELTGVRCSRCGRRWKVVRDEQD